MKKICGTIWLIGIWMLSACTNNITEIPIEGGGDVTLTLTFQCSQPYEPGMSRAGNPDENEIKEIDFAVFRVEQGMDYFDHLITVPKTDIDNGKQPNGTVTVDIQLPGEIVSYPEKAVRLMVLINVHDEIENFIATHNITAESMTEKRFFYENLVLDYEWDAVNQTPFHSMPMTGYTPAVIMNMGETYRLINVHRSFSRIDVIVDKDNKYATRSYFKIQRVWVMGMHQKGCILRNYNDNNQNYVNEINIPASKTRLVDFRHFFDLPANSHKLEAAIYVTESAALDMTNKFDWLHIEKNGKKTLYTDANPTSEPFNGVFLILQATREGVPGFYRIDFNEKLTRNRKFVINIIRVWKNGYATLEEAMLSPQGTTRTQGDAPLEVEIYQE